MYEVFFSLKSHLPARIADFKSTLDEFREDEKFLIFPNKSFLVGGGLSLV